MGNRKSKETQKALANERDGVVYAINDRSQDGYMEIVLCQDIECNHPGLCLLYRDPNYSTLYEQIQVGKAYTFIYTIKNNFEIISQIRAVPVRTYTGKIMNFLEIKDTAPSALSLMNDETPHEKYCEVIFDKGQVEINNQYIRVLIMKNVARDVELGREYKVSFQLFADTNKYLVISKKNTEEKKNENPDDDASA
jgi:hypothetical protein